MNIRVHTESASVEYYPGASDAILDSGGLLVVQEVLGDEVSGDEKVLTMVKPIDRGPDLPPREKTVEYYLLAMYAPGAWTRVTFQ